MRKWWLFLSALAISAAFLQGCKKNVSEERFTPIIKPYTPDFTTTVNAAAKGFITDENGNALENATVKGGNITVTTDKYGYFKINDADFATSAGFVQVSKPGYFTGYRTFLPVAGQEAFIRLQLIPKTNTGVVESPVGGTVTTNGEAAVTLPPNAVVVASTNTAYTGLINISARWLNPAEAQTTQLTMPGNLTGIDSAGHLNILVTYGMLVVELTGLNGELLQMATGKKALLHFPLPAPFNATSPATILLWYFDETKGVWKQEGRAVKNGNSYNGEVSHFSWWNCDVPYPLVSLKAQVVNNSLQPLSNIPVTVGIPELPGSERVLYSDTAGFVNGLVPATSNLTLGVLTPCNQNIAFRNIVTVNNDIDLGAIEVNLGQNAATISGSVTKCNGNPVTNGRVIVTGLDGNSIITINNGVFSTAGVVCDGANAAMVAFDDEAVQQSNVINITLSTGNNDAGTLSACNAPTTEIITIQSTTDTFFTLPQHLFGGNFYFLNDSTVINAVDLLNGNQLSFQFSFTGAATAGTHPLGNNKFSLAGIEWEFVAATSVTVSSYGLVGQFVTGSFGGSAIPVGGGTAQNFTINFNVKRDQ